MDERNKVKQNCVEFEESVKLSNTNEAKNHVHKSGKNQTNASRKEQDNGGWHLEIATTGLFSSGLVSVSMVQNKC